MTMKPRPAAAPDVPDGDSTLAPAPVTPAFTPEPVATPADPPSAVAPPPPEAPTPPRDEVPFPVPGWDRYRPVRFLGQGGMGRVFLALDVRLQREVALKFVRGDDPELTRRILLEGRAQARVKHERVCQVYEVGEVDGLTFIAMQFVDGQPLSELGPVLTVEQKALVLRDVALGVHEAHRVGLIHRDLKPSNVMVERSAEGALRPYVMDFGLARPWNEVATATGSILGTPHYMSPEQARGEVSRLDRRSDVYSLGATLYHLLTGGPPVSGSNALEVLSRIPTEEPRPPRALDPDVPEDLAAIALRCLEKDRSDRYDSSRALAEDLERFLSGEPILARAGRWYRLRRRLRKHRALVAVGAAALLLVSVALGWAALTRRDAALREQLARRFTERAEGIEARARYSGLAPLHDTRKDRQALRASMAELEAEIGEGGGRAVGPGQYALGRGYLALGEHQRAREALEAAWARGYREPRVAYALALALGHQYQERLTEAQRIQDRDQRRARWAEVQRRDQGPLLSYLRLSAGADVPSTEYVAALIAYCEQRYDDALARLDAMGETFPWFYEAAQLRGDVLWARSYARWETGDQDGQRADLLAGRRAYEDASAIARSVPSVYDGLARLELQALLGEMFGEGDVLPHYERGLQAVARALEVAPDDAQSWVLQSELHRRFAEYHLNHGGDVDAPLARALRSADEAVSRAPNLAQPRMELAQVYWLRGHVLDERARDPGEELRRAAELLEGLSGADRSADYYLSVGRVFTTWADAEDGRSEDSGLHRGKAIDAYLAATRLDEQSPRAWSSLGTAYFARASAARAADPDGDLDRAKGALARAQQLNPRYVVPFYSAGQVEEALAARAQARAADPRPALAEALAQYEKGLAINPGFLALLNGVGNAHLSRAQAEWDLGGDPFPALEQARAAFARMLEIDPRQSAAATNIAETTARQARYRALRGEDPAELTQQAVALFRRAAELKPDSSRPLANQGLVLMILAEFELKHARDPGAHLAMARAAGEAARAKNPRDGSAWRVIAGVRGLEARWRALKGAPRSGDFEAAAELYRKGLELAPELRALRLEYAELCLTWTELVPAPPGSPAPALDQARRVTQELLAAQSGWPEAHALHAGVLAVEAEQATAGDRAGLRQRALDELSAAMTANPSLTSAWRDRREALQRRLAASSP